MLGQPPVFLLVPLEMLFRPTLHAAVHLLLLAGIGGVVSLQHEEVGIVAHHLGIFRIESTLAEGEIIDRIQQIGLPLTVVSDETVELGRKVQRSRLYILVVYDG